MPTTYLTRDGDVLDAVCAAHYGTENQGAAVVRVLEANRGLAERGASYPAGLVILLPDLPAAARAPDINLWD